jgi:hypothetical protein
MGPITKVQIIGYVLANLSASPATESNLMPQLRYEYLRYNYPIRNVQAVIHNNGTPKISDLVLIRRQLYENVNPGRIISRKQQL